MGYLRAWDGYENRQPIVDVLSPYDLRFTTNHCPGCIIPTSSAPIWFELGDFGDGPITLTMQPGFEQLVLHAVPEPSTATLLLLALTGLGARRRPSRR